MRDQLIQYVNLMFAGAKDSEDIKQEILQNTLDRYDDLVAEGKSPEAAYRLAITGIGDINEILGTQPHTPPVRQASAETNNDTSYKKLMRAIGIGLYIICMIPLFILSEMGMDTIGLCGTLAIVAVATMLMVLGSKKAGKSQEESGTTVELTPQQELNKSVGSMIWAVGLALYFIISFTTNAWHLTWLIFPAAAAVNHLASAILGNGGRTALQKGTNSIIWALGLAIYFIVSFATGAWHITWVIFLLTGAVQGLVRAIIDLLEAIKNEN